MYTLPTGEIVKLMERGQMTIPAKFRKRLGLFKDNLLNVFEWKGMVVVVPVEFKAKNIQDSQLADWSKDSPKKYLQKVRYNPLEELWLKVAREK